MRLLARKTPVGPIAEWRCGLCQCQMHDFSVCIVDGMVVMTPTNVSFLVLHSIVACLRKKSESVDPAISEVFRIVIDRACPVCFHVKSFVLLL